MSKPDGAASAGARATEETRQSAREPAAQVHPQEPTPRLVPSPEEATVPAAEPSRHTLEPAVPTPGQLLAGRYTVLSLLGQGGMGVVVAAYDMRLDRRVALKLMRPHGSHGSQGELQLRFTREAQAMARLSHPNVVAVYDSGSLEDDSLFLTMELVEGQTLQEWCKQQPRSWREVLQAYVAAGRGLAAAHAAGVVHRDFKPSNVLVGKQGQVRVTDFGVARAVTRWDLDTGSNPTPNTLSSGAWETPLTQAGRIVGTPRYMAPEVLKGEPGDTLSDLFAYCVALYEALYDQPAFTGQTRAERWLKQQEGRVEPPPAQTPVPAWVTRAVLSGLRADPRERPASMEALLALLEDDPEVRRRARLRVAALALGAVALVGFSWAGWRLGSPPLSCEQLAHVRLQGTWDESVRDRVRASFLATNLSYANASYERVSVLLDRYTQEWRQLRTQACEASQEQPQQPRSLATLELNCLERQRSQVRALTELFARGMDAQSLLKAVPAVQSLPPLEYCMDDRVLTSAVPLPEDPVLRARVEDLYEQVDRLQALYTSGRYREGLERTEPLLKQTAEVEYAPLRARALHVAALLREGTGDYAGAEALVRQALPLASQGKEDMLVAQAWSSLLHLVGGRQGRHAEALGLVLSLESAAERTGDDLMRAISLNTQGNILWQMGRYPEARDKHERALALRLKALGPDHPEVATSLNGLANALWDMGQNQAAKEKYERALAVRLKAFGPEHPLVAASHNNLGLILDVLGHYEQAKEQHERALALGLKALGPDHPQVLSSLSNLGTVTLEMGHYAQAQELFERTLAIRLKTLVPEHPLIAASRHNLGTALALVGRYAEAQEQYERALALRLKTLGPEHSLVATSLSNLGNVLVALGRHEEAREKFERALAVWNKAQAQEHPEVAHALSGLGRVLVRLGQMNDAERHFERALALQEKVLGPRHPELADPLLGLGELLLARGQPARAAAPLERALALAGPDYLARVQLALAQALWAADTDRKRALTLATAARDFFQQVGHKPRLAEASLWLSQHPSP